MDEIDRLSLEAPPAPEYPELDKARARRLLTQESEPARRPGLGWRVPLAAGVAVTATVAVAVAFIEESAPRQPVALDAKGLLLSAARVAEKDELNPRPGQYIVRESMGTNEAGGAFVCPVDDPDCDEKGLGGTWLRPSKSKSWRSVDGKRDELMWIKTLKPRPYPGKPIPSLAWKHLGTEWSYSAPCPGGGSWNYTEWSKLPIDEQGMRDHLYSATAGGSRPADVRAWTAAADLLREYLPGKQRAALYRAVATIPGVKVVQKAKDAAGREGVAVTRDDAEAGTRDEIILHRKTHVYLGARRVVVDPEKAEAPKGSIVGSGAVLKTSVADSLPRPPKGVERESC